MPAFHDSMRLFVAGMGVAHPCGGSRNVNRWPSRILRRIMRLASTRHRCVSATATSGLAQGTRRQVVFLLAGLGQQPIHPATFPDRRRAGRSRDPCTASVSCRPRSSRSSSTFRGIRRKGGFSYHSDNHIQTPRGLATQRFGNNSRHTIDL